MPLGGSIYNNSAAMDKDYIDRNNIIERYLLHQLTDEERLQILNTGKMPEENGESVVDAPVVTSGHGRPDI